MKFSSLKRFRIVPLFCVILGFLALDRPALRPEPHGQKPMFPVLAQLELTGSPSPGGTARILASITAWIPSDDLSWKLEIPSDLDIVTGQTTWSGRLERGETRTFEIEILVPDGEPRQVSAVLQAVERPQYRSAAALEIDLGAVEGPKASRQIVTGDGTEYIQYQGTIVPR
jgi:hypothetical protein